MPKTKMFFIHSILGSVKKYKMGHRTECDVNIYLFSFITNNGSCNLMNVKKQENRETIFICSFLKYPEAPKTCPNLSGSGGRINQKNR